MWFKAAGETGSYWFYLGSFGQQQSHVWVVVFSGLVQSRLTRLLTRSKPELMHN